MTTGMAPAFVNQERTPVANAAGLTPIRQWQNVERHRMSYAKDLWKFIDSLNPHVSEGAGIQDILDMSKTSLVNGARFMLPDD